MESLPGLDLVGSSCRPSLLLLLFRSPPDPGVPSPFPSAPAVPSPFQPPLSRRILPPASVSVRSRRWTSLLALPLQFSPPPSLDLTGPLCLFCCYCYRVIAA
uniref:Predicted protein n=1 Tax=Hordeum vulgare subsp. vulgare TaxID=112509 RepID=F2DZY9_HORVV|nr:predicted protein [Hordeum vulgare subsp. vulgare]